MVRAALVVVVTGVAAGAGCATEPSRPAPLPPLPLPAGATTDRFVDAGACAQCHYTDQPQGPLHDAAGANVSPMLLWRSSLMALAARDPYYLAVFAEERAGADGVAAIDATCTRCHGPAGAEELAGVGDALGFDDLVAGTAPAAILARGGVTCSLCHQIDPDNLGDERSFSGGFDVGYDRKIFGRYANPMVGPMQLIVDYTPTLGEHVADAALCGTCHTLVVPTGSGEVVEQATYLEWRSSSFSTQGTACQACHVPVADADGHAISTEISMFPDGLAPREPFGQHVFVGGNSYVLALLADGAEWSGAGLDPAELAASAARDEAHLRDAARLTVVDLHRDGGDVVLTVRVENRAGHKLPTGYPSRRVWLHLRAGAVESGAVDARGALIDGDGAVLPPQPHRDAIDDPAHQVQVWEATLVDANGAPTHRALDARRVGKDDRILPLGFAPSAADSARTAVVGVTADPNFVPGQDDVTYRLPAVTAGASIEVELVYEALAPEIVDAIDDAATPAGTRFVDLARARPIQPVRIAQLTATAP